MYVIYISVLGRTDFEHPIFSSISSQSCFIEMELLKNGAQSQSVHVIDIIYITVLGRTDFEHPIFSIISSESC